MYVNYISEPLTYMFNLRFSTGKILHELKGSLLTPVYKADDNKQLTNYRPISRQVLISVPCSKESPDDAFHV